MPFDFPFDELSKGFLKRKNSNESNAFGVIPGLLDTELFLCLADLAKTPTGRDLIRNHFEISEKSLRIIAEMDRSNVRNFIGILNVSFQPAISHDEIVKEFQDGMYSNYSRPLGPINKEDSLFHRFCSLFWGEAVRQIGHNERLARLLFGLSPSLIKVLQESSMDHIIGFINSKNHRFALRLGERFFQAIPTIPNAGTNTQFDRVKMLYAVQSAACFEQAPSTLSVTDSYDFNDVVARSDFDKKTIKNKLAPQLLKGIGLSSWKANNHEIRLKQKAFQDNIFHLRSKQFVVTQLAACGLTKSQIAYTCGVDVWQVRQETKEVIDAIDSRTRVKVKKTPSLHIEQLLFICLYVTFASESGLEIPNLKAFFSALECLKHPVITCRLGEPQVPVADIFDHLKYLTQGLLYLQSCPTCKSVSVHMRNPGEFLCEDEDLKPCSLCHCVSEDGSLSMFSEFIRNSHELTPELL